MSALNNNTLALVSGGVDSCILVHLLARKASSILPVYARCGLIWERAELVWLRRWLSSIDSRTVQPLEVWALPLEGIYESRHWSLSGRYVPDANSRDEAVELPGRNLMLLSLASVSAAKNGYKRITLGSLNGNPFPDARPAFFRQMSACASTAMRCRLHIEAPLLNMRKHELIRRFPEAPLALTFSCIKPIGIRHCGRCNKCRERQQAFKAAGRADPTRYAA